MTRRGRPRGLVVNPAAVEDLLTLQCLSKARLCSAAGVSPGHLADMLHRGKGASPAVVHRLAAVLGCADSTLAPELGGFTPPEPPIAACSAGRASQRSARQPASADPP